MDWRLKALAFRVLDLPGGTYAHYFLQRHVTRNWPRPATTLTSLESIARRVIDDYARHLGGTPSSVLEIGAGRDLAVPLALRKLGVAKIITSDVDRLARLDLIQHAAAQILAGEVKLDSWDALERFGIYYRAPHYVTDAAQKKAQERLAELVPNAKHITKTNSGHEIHKEQPQLVIDAIREVVDAVRSSGR